MLQLLNQGSSRLINHFYYMILDINILKKILASFRSKKCWWVSYGGSAGTMILLHIDKMITRKHKLKNCIYPINSYSGSKAIRTYNANWVIKKNNKTILSSKVLSSDIESKEISSLLINKYIDDIFIDKDMNLTVIFDKKTILKIKPEKKDIEDNDPYYIIDGGKNKRFSIDSKTRDFLKDLQP